MDLRFEALRMDMAGHFSLTQYVVNRSAGGKMAKPKPVGIGQCKIFQRLGHKKAARYFDEMTPEQIHKQMKATTAGIRAAKGVKP